MFLDFVVVVLGILVALQAEEWRQFRNDRGEERLVLSNISKELSTDVEVIKNYIARSDEQAAVMNELLESLRSEESLEPRDFAQRYVDAVFFPVLSITSPTYTGLKEDGRLSIILSDDLRNRIIAYYERVAPLLVSTEERAWRNQQDLLDQSRTWLYRSSIDKPFQGWTIVEVELVVGDVWRFAVADSLSDIARDMDWIKRASELSYSLKQVKGSAVTTLEATETILAVIDAQLAQPPVKEPAG